MASKEATVYIVDVGASMGRQNHDRDVTDLDWALEYIWDKITTTVATDRKTALVGVVGLNTDGTHNELEGEDAYKHITVFQDLKQTLMPDLRQLKSNLKPSKTDSADAISALVVAIQMITTHCRQLQYIRRIVLVTNGLGPMDTSDMETIIQKVKDDNMELIILGVDFDDQEYGFQESHKNSRKATNEKALKELAEGCNGVCGTLVQAIEELSIPRIKTVRPITSYKGYLTLGNPEDYDTAMAIDIERYPKVMVAKPPTASSFVIRSDMAPGESTQPSSLPDEGTNGDGLAGVKNARTYQVPDESAPGGKRDFEAESLAKGYAYGSTAVYISESDRNVTTYETKPGMDIIGFVDRNKYERYLDMSRSYVIVAQRSNDKAALALSSFIHALYELESYAVARLVVKENKAPQILLLAPSIEPDLECLYDVELPFAEDVRSYRFSPLDRVITVSGKELKTHRNLPSDALVDAMSSYVDSMDLSTLGEDNTEYAPIDDTFSPILHRVNQVIRHRAIYAGHDLPPIPDILTKYSHPPSTLIVNAKPSLDAVLAAADIKRVDPKQRGRRFRNKNRDAEKPMSGLDVGALLNEPATRKQRATISATNAIPEFKQAADAAYASGDMGQVHDVAEQMGNIIREYIRSSFGEVKYEMAVEAIRVLREEAIEMEIFEWFNAFLGKLKGELLGGELSGDRVDMWWKIRLARLGLITKKEVGASEVDEEAAKEFLRSK
ncbi:hypothetical protein MBLNU457_6297t1 [Dothideomycetes sp. NU457]